jgi:hypothetical protein
LIQDIWAVCGSNQNDSFVGFKTIHLDEKLIESLFSFVVSTTQACSSMPSDCVYFIDKNDAWGISFPLVVKVSDSRSSNTYEHLNKISTGNAEKGHTGFAGNGFGQQCFSSSWRA